MANEIGWSFMLKKISAVLFFCISLPALANSNECGLPDSAIKAYEQNIIDHCRKTWPGARNDHCKRATKDTSP